MKNKERYTPVIVGTVIAIIGILIGLYFAENAHERLVSQTNVVQEEQPGEVNGQVGMLQVPADTTVAPMPLEPITIDELPPLEDVEKPVEPTLDTAPDVRTEPVEEETASEEVIEVDDFVEVDPAEEERRTAEEQPSGGEEVNRLP